ncbi:MAG: cytochrome o ubiquinol oxidase subunit IV [Legionellales bacterium]|nr:cytochrome o ubiquinol oxidase subunit IV [Legionellales bacterium]|tara:strand:- start:2553 stop:2909 length:357 start_codon:yes stop_codon:yes gene_type:complete
MADNYNLDNHTQQPSQLNQGTQKIRSYITGFVLSLILTFTAFILVEKQLLSSMSLFYAIGIIAILELIVMAVCFLKVNVSEEDTSWNIASFIFTLLIVAIVVCGSLWIMYNLNYNMVH